MADRIVWDHKVIEEAEDSFADEVLAKAEAIKAAADAMRTRPSIAPYHAALHKGKEGGRRYAVVSARAPSTKADEERTNALNKAAGSC